MSEPLTKDDLTQALAAFSEKIDKRFEQMSAHFDERIYETETKLLRAFSDYNDNARIRMRKLEADMSNLDTSNTIRLAALEEQTTNLVIRVMKLEAKP